MKKKFYLSRTDRWIAGVCGGLAEYFGVDTMLVRTLFFCLAWFLGASIWFYIILWIFAPLEPRKKWTESE